MQSLNTHEIPPGGWQFRQPQTGWKAPTPISSTYGQTVTLIVQHRLKNPAITTKHQLSTEPDVVGEELLQYNRKRLHIPDPAPKPSFFSPARSLPAHVVAAAAGVKRAAAGTAVVLDWLQSGGMPVSPELAAKRAAVCVGCPKNVPGSWYTTAPAEIIKAALDARGDLKLSTPDDEKLKSCDICKCVMRLKCHTPMEFIVKHTKPEIMAEFPSHCWIFKRDQ